MKNFEEFKSLSNKMKVFESIDNLLRYVETNGDFIELFGFLSDEEKLVVVQKDYYLRQSDTTKNKTILLIKDSKILDIIISDKDLRKKILTELSFYNIMTEADNINRRIILEDPNLIKEFYCDPFQIEIIVRKMKDEDKKEIIESPQISQKLGLDDSIKSSLVAGLHDDDYKIQYVDKNKLESYQRDYIVSSIESDKVKQEYILEKYADADESDTLAIIASLSQQGLMDFLKTHRDFLDKKGIPPFKIFKNMVGDKLLDCIYNLDKFEILEADKKCIFIYLDSAITEQIDKSKIDDKYSKLMDMPKTKLRKIDI